MLSIFVLLAVFQIKHFFSDFPLQTPYMLGKMQVSGWFFPLLAHALVHAFFTLAIVLTINPKLWWLALIDLVVHFVVDRIKASPKLLNRFTPQDRMFWWTLGVDQMMHHLTHYFIIYMLVTYNV